MNHKYRVLIADKITDDGLTPLEQDDRFELERRIGLDQEALADALVEIPADTAEVKPGETVLARLLDWS